MLNPFSTKFWSPGTLPFLFSERRETLDTLLAKSQRLPICQIVGPHGTGKSTLLLELMKRYEKNGANVWYLFFNDQQRHIPHDLPSQKNHIFFVDGLEQLSCLNQGRLLLRLKHSIVTAHRPVWSIPVLYQTKSQFSIFIQLVRKMLPNPPDESTLRDVYDRSGGNVRNAFFELYDQWEKSDSVSHCYDVSRRTPTPR